MRSGLEVPTIETKRLVLRGHRLEDFSDCAAMWADSGVVRYLGGVPLSEEDVWARMLRYIGHWTLMGFGFWAVEEKDTGRFAGELGFARFRRDLEPPLEDAPEIGWILAPRAQGRGYATEGVRAAVAWGDAHFGGGSQTVCLIHPDNAPSIRVAEKCGYRELRKALYKGRATVVFGRQNVRL